MEAVIGSLFVLAVLVMAIVMIVVIYHRARVQNYSREALRVPFAVTALVSAVLAVVLTAVLAVSSYAPVVMVLAVVVIVALESMVIGLLLYLVGAFNKEAAKQSHLPFRLHF